MQVLGSIPRKSRWLLAAGLVLGLFLMHGLTADHDAAMPMSSAAMEMSAGSEPHALTMSAASDSQDSDRSAVTLARAEATDSASPLASALSTAMDHGMSMGGICLALLGAGLMLRMLLARRLRRSERPALESLVLGLVRQAAGPNRSDLAPSLHRLCVSRT